MDAHRGQKRVGSYRVVITDSCELLDMGDWNKGPLEEQQALLTAELPLLPHANSLNVKREFFLKNFSMAINIL